MSSLRHPHIVRLVGSGRRGLKNGFEPFLVLEYLAGNTLGNLISERRRGELVPPHFVLDGKKNYIPWAQAMGWAQVRGSLEMLESGCACALRVRACVCVLANRPTENKKGNVV